MLAQLKASGFLPADTQCSAPVAPPAPEAPDESTARETHLELGSQYSKAISNFKDKGIKVANAKQRLREHVEAAEKRTAQLQKAVDEAKEAEPKYYGEMSELHAKLETAAKAFEAAKANAFDVSAAGGPSSSDARKRVCKPKRPAD